MDHHDHVNLLRPGIVAPGGVWADLGAGSGAFTLALADLIGPTGELHVIDRDAGALRANKRAVHAQFPEVRTHYYETDFTSTLDLPPLDGLVMANSLHFQVNQETLVQQLRALLRASGRMLVVEYNIDRGNYAVPHPVPYARWQRIASQAGFAHTELLSKRPSRFLNEIYSAASW